MGQNAGGAKIVEMIKEILNDSKKTEDEGMAAEQDAQAGYEEFMKNSNKALTANLRAITNMMENKAKSEEALTLAKDDLKATLKDLEDLNDVLGGLHRSCD